MIKRLFDIVCSTIGILVLSPLLIILSFFVVISSPGGVFYRQVRVGLNGIDFSLLKFRTMKPNSDKAGLLTIGSNDKRITSIGRWLRKYKLDELPQLFNVLNGTMSLVGPRPEVRKYVELYNERQKEVLKVRPGITDYASIEYSNENDLLARSSDPEKTYIEEVMPAKLNLALRYIDEKNLLTDIKIIGKTFLKVLR